MRNLTFPTNMYDFNCRYYGVMMSSSGDILPFTTDDLASCCGVILELSANTGNEEFIKHQIESMLTKYSSEKFHHYIQIIREDVLLGSKYKSKFD